MWVSHAIIATRSACLFSLLSCGSIITRHIRSDSRLCPSSWSQNSYVLVVMSVLEVYRGVCVMRVF